MKKAYYREQALERIARDVITAYDPRLYYGSPAAIPIEDIIEAQGLVLEYNLSPMLCASNAPDAVPCVPSFMGRDDFAGEPRQLADSPFSEPLKK